jgi:hypothetical protein
LALAFLALAFLALARGFLAFARRLPGAAVLARRFPTVLAIPASRLSATDLRRTRDAE